MNEPSPVEVADRASRRRARMWGAMALIFMAFQGAFAPWAGPARLAHIKPWIWIVLCVAVLANLATGGGLFLSGKVRRLLNDEVSSDHRRRALANGFWMAMAMALVLFVIAQFSELTGAEATYLTVTIALATSLLTFAVLERRAHRDA